MSQVDFHFGSARIHFEECASAATSILPAGNKARFDKTFTTEINPEVEDDDPLSQRLCAQKSVDPKYMHHITPEPALYFGAIGDQ